MAKKKYYVVWEGHETGIFNSWADCEAQIKGYPQAKYKSYTSLSEAQEALAGNYWAAVGSGKKKSSSQPSAEMEKEVVWHSLSVDAACSGNPGVMEYQGVDTQTGRRIFHQKFALGTNNIGEFLALVHGLAYLQKEELPNLPIYTDSRTAMSWLRNKKVKTNLVQNARTKQLFVLIQRAENWLKNNSYENPILKWDTENWGEIPADFGRK